MKYKFITLIVFAGLSQQVSAADEFVCKIETREVFTYSCNECVKRRAENCIEEKEITCYDSKVISTGLEYAELHPNEKLTMADSNGNYSFFLKQNKDGYIAKVGSKNLNAFAEIQSSQTFDPYLDKVQLTAYTQNQSQVSGNITEVILNCRPR